VILIAVVGRNKPCTLAVMTISPLAGLFYLVFVDRQTNKQIA